MSHFRVEVGPKDRQKDLLGKTVLNEIKEDLKISGIEGLFVVSVFEINAGLGKEEVIALCKNLFCDPVTEEFSVNDHLFSDFDFSLEVGYSPGVTDNIGLTAMRAVKDFLGRPLAENETIASKKLFVFLGSLTEEIVREIALKKLFNHLIEEIKIFSGKKSG
ncbi:MAG: hypothetical protein HYW50_03640 [Candidatus Diapherotrites archaeon]|nr:hypothetical protein [Candidatus Diapherotrites archaeon]